VRTIDLDTWPRREHFAFFRRSDLPFYNVNMRVKVTGLPEFARSQGLSLNHTLVFLTVQALNAIENFRYRLRGEEVVLHERIHPSFAHLREGEELFRMITVDCLDDLRAFDALCRQEIDASCAYFDMNKFAGRDDFVFISALPWLSFTGIDHTLSLRRDDAMPRVSWGKIEGENGCSWLPYNLQVNHLFVDGLHVGRFFTELDRLIGAIQHPID